MTTTERIEARERSHNLARFQRIEEAVELLKGQLSDLPLDAPTRPALLLELAQIQIHSSQRDQARETLSALAEFESGRAAVEGLWLDYYQGNLEAALEGADARLSEVQQWSGTNRVRADLLFGKLLTDGHHLEEARKWLVHGMDHARDIADFDLLAACCGALAEVFYRGGALRPALELIELDAALLPAGSFHVARLRVYRAHCYRQFGQVEAARSLYNEAFQAARLRGFGMSYPLRGLIWCDALEIADGGSREAYLSEINRHLESLQSIGEPHSLGHGLVGSAWAEALCDNEERRQELLDEAAAVFDDSYFSREAAWCKRRGDAVAPAATQPAFPASDVSASACNKWLLEVPLEPLGPRWKEGAERFDGKSSADALAWMGLFF